jgi:presenilin-like A22 family membrane protease
VKLTLKNALIILVAGMVILAAGSLVESSREHISNPIVMMGLIVEFLGTIWLVLSLNQRRKKQRL